jgi:hypothetical protein
MGLVYVWTELDSGACLVDILEYAGGDASQQSGAIGWSFISHGPNNWTTQDVG